LELLFKPTSASAELPVWFRAIVQSSDPSKAAEIARYRNISLSRFTRSIHRAQATRVVRPPARDDAALFGDGSNRNH
jgi:hypothetical protein